MKLRALCLFGSLICPGVFAQPALTPVDGVAAIVNQAIITKSELDQQVKLAKRQGHPGAQLDKKRFEKQILEQLIANEIQLQLAKKTGIEVSDEMVQEAIQNMANQHHMSLAQLKEALQQEGMNFNQYRRNVQEQLTLNQLQQRDVFSTVTVTDQEVEQFLRSPTGLGELRLEYRLSHILIPLPESPSSQQIQQAKDRAQGIVGRLKEGASFAQLALDEQTSSDLGWRKLPDIPTLFVKIVPHLRVGEVAQPIRSPNGYHIVQLSDKREVEQTLPKVKKTLARHILIKTNALTSDTAARNRLVSLKQKIQAGTDFAVLAKTHSADLVSAAKGGNIGWVTEAVLVPEFVTQMNKLSKNQLSQPFKTPFGWHLLEVLDRKTEKESGALKAKAMALIQQRKFEEKRELWARQLRDEAFVKIEYPA